jgi:T5orf172 domain
MLSKETKKYIQIRSDGLVSLSGIVSLGSYSKQCAEELIIAFCDWRPEAYEWLEEINQIVSESIFPDTAICCSLVNGVAWVHPAIAMLFVAKSAKYENRYVTSEEFDAVISLLLQYIKLQGLDLPEICTPYFLYKAYLVKHDLCGERERTQKTSKVYFIHDKKSRSVKIGTSTDTPERLYSLQIGNSNSLSIIGVIDGNRKLEKELHKTFRKHHIRGEWFRDEIIVDLKALIQ